MKAYTIIWFEIKASPYVTSGARHIFKAIFLVKQQSNEVQKVVFPVLQKMCNLLNLNILLLPCLQMKALTSGNWRGGESRKVVPKSRPKNYENSRLQSSILSAKTTTSFHSGNGLM